MYVEITYESNDVVLQYFKQDNKWINIGEFSIYCKRNYKWNLVNDLQVDSYVNKKYLIEVIE